MCLVGPVVGVRGVASALRTEGIENERAEVNPQWPRPAACCLGGCVSDLVYYTLDIVVEHVPDLLDV
ncbi:MAG: hypothetical protein JXQ75_00425 [Phycisphaerae bacterium]|nr:hypothetical protein [Phycisphaerae bacterium]